MGKMIIMLLLSVSFSLISLGQNKKNSSSEITLQNAFFVLDTVWTPGEPQRFALHGYNNYLSISDNWATVYGQGRGSAYFRGPIKGVKISDDENGFRTTYFYIASVQIAVELREIGEDVFEIHVYEPLGSFDKRYIGRYVSPEKVEEVDMHKED